MLKIRLKRTGRKKKPFYLIVLAKDMSKRDGKSIAQIGFYEPTKKVIRVNKIAFQKYLNNGAYPTDTVRHLFYKALDKAIRIENIKTRNVETTKIKS